MKNLGRIVIMGAALLMPAQLSAQPGKWGRRGGDIELSHRRGPVYSCPSRVGIRGAGCRGRLARVAIRPGARRGWVRARWGALHVYSPRTRARSVRIGERGLREVLGPRTVRRFRRLSRHAGLRGPMTGVWQTSRRFGSELHVRIAGRRVAEVYDYDRDGYADQVLLARSLVH